MLHSNGFQPHGRLTVTGFSSSKYQNGFCIKYVPLFMLFVRLHLFDYSPTRLSGTEFIISCVVKLFSSPLYAICGGKSVKWQLLPPKNIMNMCELNTECPTDTMIARLVNFVCGKCGNNFTMKPYVCNYYHDIHDYTIIPQFLNHLHYSHFKYFHRYWSPTLRHY